MCVCYEVYSDFLLKAIVRWRLIISFYPWKHTLICFIAYLTLSLESCVVAALNIVAWSEKETVEINSRWGIRVKDNTEPSPAFLITDQTELPFLQHKPSKTHMGEMKPREAHVLKCFAGSRPERLANICLLHWFHTKCPYAYRRLFFLECLKTVLDYKLCRKKLL